MSAPSVKTVKRLFAVSGNRCAFPRCRTALVDVETGKVTGRICHIKGSLPGSTRYDPNQADEERHGFDNLLLMCPLHHDVIDADPDSYTVDRLRKIKQEHEASYAGGAEPSDKVADQLIAETLSMNGMTIRDGSFIISKDQMGGQARRVSKSVASTLIEQLRQYPSEAIDIVAVMGDSDSFELASILEGILKQAGWQSSGVSQAIFSGVPKDVILETPTEKPSVQALGNWLLQVGLKPQGFLKPGAKAIKVIVGPAT